MAITNPFYELPFGADTDLPPYLIAKVGAAEGNCAIASASTDKFLGLTGRVLTPAGATASIVTDGSELCTYGGAVAYGDLLTSDANGHAVTASPAAGATVSIIGEALESGAQGDVRPIKLNISRLKG